MGRMSDLQIEKRETTEAMVHDAEERLAHLAHVVQSVDSCPKDGTVIFRRRLATDRLYAFFWHDSSGCWRDFAFNRHDPINEGVFICTGIPFYAE